MSMNYTELKIVNSENYLSVSEASETLKIKETAIRNYLYEGKIKTYKFKGLTLLSKNEVHNWKTNRKR